MGRVGLFAARSSSFESAASSALESAPSGIKLVGSHLRSAVLTIRVWCFSREREVIIEEVSRHWRQWKRVVLEERIFGWVVAQEVQREWSRRLAV